MARQPKSLSIKEINTTTITSLDYVVPSGVVTNASLVVTNNSGTINTVDVYVNDTVSDHLLVSKKIASGIGKTWRVLELSDIKLNTGFEIKIKLSSANLVNFYLSGSEISES